MPGLDSWMSPQIPAGSRFHEEILGNLDHCAVGVQCLTAENAVAEWIHVEAGALAAFSKPTIVYRIDKEAKVSDLLADLQHLRATQEGTRDLLTQVVTLTEGSTSEALRAFRTRWPAMKQALDDVHTDAGFFDGSTPGIVEVSKRIDDQANRLSQLVRSSILGRASDALQQLSGLPVQRTIEGYRLRVERELARQRNDDTVLALCGRKGLEPAQEEAYFASFMSRAKQLFEEEGGQDRVRVCRIFVLAKRRQGKRLGVEARREESPRQAIIRMHRSHRKHGVIALTLPTTRRAPHAPAWLTRQAAEGFGFLLFLRSSTECIGITHDGARDGFMPHRRIRDPVLLLSLLDCFHELCNLSREWRKEKKLVEPALLEAERILLQRQQP